MTDRDIGSVYAMHQIGKYCLIIAYAAHDGAGILTVRSMEYLYPISERQECGIMMTV